MVNKYKDLYINNKETIESLLPLGKVREQGIKDFDRLGIPVSKMEKWRNFNLKDFSSDEYKIDLSENPKGLDFFAVLNDFESEDALLFYNGFCTYEMQLEEYKNGVIFGSLRAAMNKYPDIVRNYFNKANKQNLNGFNALNTAFSVDGFFLYVPENTNIDIPFTVINHFNSSDKHMVNFRNLVIIENNSHVSINHVESSDKNDKQFVNNVSEIFVGEKSTVSQSSFQKYKGETVVVNPTFVHQKAKSTITKNIGTIGGYKVRNDIHIKLTGKDCYSDVNGVYILNNKDLVENQVYLDHAVPDCDSNQLFKGVLDGHSKGAFTGYVLVRKDAQRINAYQSNKNIVISDDAKMNTNPFLEIYADDVKCSHGASVGSLDENALFYMKARGIDEKKAREIMLSAFAMEALEKIKTKDFKEVIASEIRKSLLKS